MTETSINFDKEVKEYSILGKSVNPKHLATQEVNVVLGNKFSFSDFKGLEFVAYKDGNLYKTVELSTGLLAHTGEAKTKTAIGEARAFKKWIKEHSPMAEQMLNTLPERGLTLTDRIEKQLKFIELALEFKKITKIDLPIDVTGVDVVKLDDKLKVPNDMSLVYFLKNNYGDRARDIVRELIEMNGIWF